MTTRYVKFCLPYKLPCANASRKEVILCLQSEDLIVQPDPACDLPITTIEGEICQAYTTCDSCTSTIWNYTVSYDDTQLTNPTTPLVASDITGIFCKDCETDWIEEQLSCIGGDIATCVEDSQTIDFSLTEEGCVTGDVLVSADADNALSIHTDGLYATSTEVCVTDSQTIDFSLDEGGCVTGDVLISADEDNCTEIRADGLYTPCGGGGGGVLQFLFGNGVDGNRTVTTEEMITCPGRNYNYNNLTINVGGELHPYGCTPEIYAFVGDCSSCHLPLNVYNDDFLRQYYIIAVSGTLTIDGSITANGWDAPNGSGSYTAAILGTCGTNSPNTTAHGGNPGWVKSSDGPGGGDDAGGAGGSGYSAANGPARAGCPCRANRSWGAGHMAGGLGGAAGAGGTGGTPGSPGRTPVITADGDFFPAGRLMFSSLYQWDYHGLMIVGGGTGGAGGGGGDATGTAQGGMGGGGGGGAGSIYIYAKNIVINATGSITAKGGKGGNGAAATAGGGGDNGAGGGGGGGGGGGLIYLVYETLTNLGTIDASGGAGGSGGASIGSYGTGNSGSSGASGNIIKLNMTTGEFE